MTGPSTASPRPMDAMTIERELNALWRAEIEANQRAGATASAIAPPSRTLLHTLLVVAPDAAAAEQARQTAAALSPRQPARTVVLQLADGREDRLDASVGLTCVSHPNGQTTVAGEHVTLIAGGPNAARRLTGAVLPLLLTNVPSFLWWMQGSPVHHPLLRDLAPVPPAASYVLVATRIQSTAGAVFGSVKISVGPGSTRLGVVTSNGGRVVRAHRQTS